MGIRHDLKHCILNLTKYNRDGSHSTQAARKKRLLLAANQLVDRGYQLRHLRQLKPKHIHYLVETWKAQQCSGQEKMDTFFTRIYSQTALG